MADCVFCRVISGELPSKFVYTGERLVAFKDLNPQAPTHVLLVPKKHIPSLAASEPQDQEILGEIQRVAKEIAGTLKLEAFRLVLNNGKMAGQTVDHLHYHLLGGRRMIWPPG